MHQLKGIVPEGHFWERKASHRDLQRVEFACIRDGVCARCDLPVPDLDGPRVGRFLESVVWHRHRRRHDNLSVRRWPCLQAGGGTLYVGRRGWVRVERDALRGLKHICHLQRASAPDLCSTARPLWLAAVGRTEEYHG